MPRFPPLQMGLRAAPPRFHREEPTSATQSELSNKGPMSLLLKAERGRARGQRQGAVRGWLSRPGVSKPRTFQRTGRRLGSWDNFQALGNVLPDRRVLLGRTRTGGSVGYSSDSRFWLMISGCVRSSLTWNSALKACALLRILSLPLSLPRS